MAYPETPRSHGDKSNTSTTGRILVVDDSAMTVGILQQLLRREGHTVLTASNGVDALDVIERERPDVVLSDVHMPLGDGDELCRAIKTRPDLRLTPVILITSLLGREERLKGIDAGADDFLTKPFDSNELRARVRSLLRLKRYTDDLDSAESVIMSLAMTVEARDPTTEGHCQRLARLASGVGARIGLPAEDVAALSRGGVLHDIGKIGIPDAVLLKPAPLTPSEFALMQQHTVIGDRLCSELRLLRRVRPIVRHHHERLDGSGYPDGLRGGKVPLLSQIMGVVDVYDALTSERPYKPAVPPEQAFDELASEARAGWRDGALVDELVRFCEEQQGEGTSALN